MISTREGEDGTYTDIALAIRQSRADPGEDLRELFRRAAFNILATNLDDHLRNHAFLFDQGSGMLRLSPAYDMNHVPASERPRHLATWISEAGDEASLDHLVDACGSFGLESDEGRGIIRGIAEVRLAAHSNRPAS